MTGATVQQIRDAVRAVLVASSDVTSVVPAERIVIGQAVPVDIDLSTTSAILLDAPREREDWVGEGPSSPHTRVETDVAIDVYVAGADDAAVQSALDLIDTVKQVLLQDATWRTANSRRLMVRRVETLRILGGGGESALGRAGLILTLSHFREYDA